MAHGEGRLRQAFPLTSAASHDRSHTSIGSPLKRSPARALDRKLARARSHTIGLENEVPNHLLVNEPSLSTQGIGGRCGRYDAYGITFASVTLPGNCERKALFIPPSSPL